MNRLISSQQSGRSMVEMLGVLAIIGVLSIGGISGYSKAMAKFKLTKAQDQLTMLIMNTRTAFATSSGYVGLNTSLAIANNILSTDMQISGQTGYAMNAFGGQVYIASASSANGVANGAFSIVFNGLGKDACTSLASSDWGADGMIGMTVSSSNKTSNTTAPTKNMQDLPLTFSSAAGLCSSPSQNSIEWWYN